jgi:hypothetical protein
MQVRYDATADRVLWQVRTINGDLFAVWLTRRMLLGLWAPLQRLITHAGVAGASPHAVVLPEAREMLAQAARERPLAGASFAQPFDPTPLSLPLGPEPLLPTAIDLGPGARGQGIHLRAREPSGRQFTLQLTDDLAIALLRLLEQALTDADWGIATAPVQVPEAPQRPTLLN